MLKSPFPYFGGKSRVAREVWARFGDVPNYVEPFCGSAAVLLARPTTPKIETINDFNGFVANFWRALKHDPQQVAAWADGPVSEADLHSRHAWLMKQDISGKLADDPDFFDCKIAGWWVWGISAWFGSGWCKWPNSKQRPNLLRGQCGVHRVKLRGKLQEYLQRLSERLRHVRVCYGDWKRICTPSVTVGHGLTGILLDAPYSDKAGRKNHIYAVDSLTVAHEVRKWAVEHGDDPMYRIAFCGYEGEHEMPDNWSVYSWNSSHASKKNVRRERIWFSPHCLEGTSSGTKTTVFLSHSLNKENEMTPTTQAAEVSTSASPELASPSALQESSSDTHIQWLAAFEGKLQIIRDRVRGVAERYHTGCYLVGRPGVSKTYTVEEELTRLGVPFVVKNAHMTAQGFFDLMGTHPRHVIVLDDIGSLFADKTAVQLLLAALGGDPQAARMVTYKTKRGDDSVSFRGGIIAISNVSLRSDPLSKALGSRMVTVEHEPSDEEVAAFMRYLAASSYKGLEPHECGEVVEFLIAEMKGHGERLDLRHLSKAFEDYRQYKAGHSETPWQDLVRSSLRKQAEPVLLPFSKKEEIELQRERVRSLMQKYPGDTKRQLAESSLGKSTFYQRLREVRIAG